MGALVHDVDLEGQPLHDFRHDIYLENLEDALLIVDVDQVRDLVKHEDAERPGDRCVRKSHAEVLHKALVLCLIVMQVPVPNVERDGILKTVLFPGEETPGCLRREEARLTSLPFFDLKSRVLCLLIVSSLAYQSNILLHLFDPVQITEGQLPLF